MKFKFAVKTFTAADRNETFCLRKIYSNASRLHTGTIAWKPKQLSTEVPLGLQYRLLLALRKLMPYPVGGNSLFHKNFLFFRKFYLNLKIAGAGKNL